MCSNKLLANVELVLFLNKCDILDTKLKSGIRFVAHVVPIYTYGTLMASYFLSLHRLAKYVRTYGERENDLESVTKCTFALTLHLHRPRLIWYHVLDLKGKFSAIHREYSPNPRKFYVFATSVTDTTTTGGIIASGMYCSFSGKGPAAHPLTFLQYVISS